MTYQWTSTCDNAYVNGTGLYNSTAADKILFAETNFTSSVTLMNGDKLNVTWGLAVS